MKILNILKMSFLAPPWLFLIGCNFILGAGNKYYNSTYEKIDITTNECFNSSITVDMACSADNDPMSGNKFWVFVTETTVNDDNPNDHTLYDGSEVEIVTDKDGKPNHNGDGQLYQVSVDKTTGVFILEYSDNKTCSCSLKHFRDAFSGVIPCTCTIGDTTCYLCYD